MSVRAFVALELPAETRRGIAAGFETISARWPGLRRTDLASLHLTLRFLGDSSPEQIEGLAALLVPAARSCPPAAGRIGGLGLFPERGAPRILWLGVELGFDFLELQRACESAACSVGFAPEARRFRPHLTLGRWRGRVPRPELVPLEIGPARFEKLVLMASRLDSRGAVYTPLHTFALGANLGNRGPLGMYPHAPRSNS